MFGSGVVGGFVGILWLIVAVCDRRAWWACAEEPQLAGGKPIKKKQYRWFAAIQSVRDDEFICGAALVGSRYVVTANHCVESVMAVKVEISYFCTDRDNCKRKNEIIGVRDLFRHPNREADMALLALDAPTKLNIDPAVPFLGAALTPGQGKLKNGRRMVMVGAGRTERFGPVSYKVEQIDVVYLPRKRCRDLLNRPDLVTNFVMCSVPQNANSCRGDSGSPIIIKGKSGLKGRQIVVAVHNFGPSDCTDAADSRPIGHFRMEEATSLLLSVICEGDHPEDWCPVAEAETTFPPTAQPTRVPTHHPTHHPTLSPLITQLPLQATVKQTFFGHTSEVLWVVVNHDGSQLASGACDDTIRLWDPVSGSSSAIRTINARSHSGCVEFVEYNAQSTLLASDTEDHTVTLWNVNDGSIYEVLDTKHRGDIWTAKWHPQDPILASGSADLSIKIWNAQTGEEVNLRTSPGHSNDVESFSFHPDGTFLASSAWQEIKIWRTSDYSLVRTLSGHTNWVRSIAYSPDGTRLASASYDGTCRIWDASTGAVIHQLFGHQHRVYSIRWSPDGKYVLTGSTDNTVRLWDAVGGGGALLVLSQPHASKCVAWMPDGRHFATASSNGTIILWELRGG